MSHPIDHDRTSRDTAASGAGDRDVAARTERSDRSPWNWLLFLPLLATLIPMLYNRNDPELFGIPFFYWYQLAAIGIGVACTVIVYRATKD